MLCPCYALPCSSPTPATKGGLKAGFNNDIGLTLCNHYFILFHRVHNGEPNHLLAIDRAEKPGTSSICRAGFQVTLKTAIACADLALSWRAIPFFKGARPPQGAQQPLGGMGDMVEQGLEGGWNMSWNILPNRVGTGVGRGLEGHPSPCSGLEVSGKVRNERRLDGGPSLAILILPSVSRQSIAALRAFFVHPSLCGCSENNLGA